MPEDEKPEVRYAFRKTLYSVVVGDLMLLLEEREIVSGEPPSDFSRFLGAGQVNEKVKTGNLQGNVQGQVPFALPNATTAAEAIEQAPALFEIAKKHFIEQAKVQAMRQAIAQPGAVPNPGANGPANRIIH